MSEFIKKQEIIDDHAKDGIVSHCVFHCLDKLAMDKDFREKYASGNGIDVCLTMNGHEVPFKKFLEEFERQYGYLLARRAEKLLDERMGRVSDAIYGFERAMKTQFHELFPDEE